MIGLGLKHRRREAVGWAAIAVAVDTETSQVYTANLQDASVPVINGATCNATNTSGCGQTPQQDAVGNYPSWIALDPAAGTAYVANINNVSVIPIGHWPSTPGSRRRPR